MKYLPLVGFAVVAGLFGFFAFSPLQARAVTVPVAVLDDTRRQGDMQTIVLAGGCFWGIEAVFEHVKGVTKAVSGYAGGDAKTAHYDQVSRGDTGHAEAVQVTYDPAQVTAGALLQVFFSVAHDPTQLNRQGPDHGTQYRSAIFFGNAAQERIAQAYVKQLDKAGVFELPVVTTIQPLATFYPAEDYHQDFAARNPGHPYIVAHDLPKVAALKRELPDLYTEK